MAMLQDAPDILDQSEQGNRVDQEAAQHPLFGLTKKAATDWFGLQNRRYLGNKYRLLGFIEDIVDDKCPDYETFCDIFSGTGVVASRFNERGVTVIANDILLSNYVPLKAFLGLSKVDYEQIGWKIEMLNSMHPDGENYFSANFGGKYFTVENAEKIGAIREKIDEISDSSSEKVILITCLLYAADKVANTVGHYDAFRKNLDAVRPLKLLLPRINEADNIGNRIYNEDANDLVRKVSCDVLYADPPYNSRQYSDAYHLLENLVSWVKPPVYGKAGKMDRRHIKSDYCMKSAQHALADLVGHADCQHILLSYNNTGESKDGRSNARISDGKILDILESRGEVEVFERNYKAFTTGRSDTAGHTERVFYCRVER